LIEFNKYILQIYEYQNFLTTCYERALLPLFLLTSYKHGIHYFSAVISLIKLQLITLVY